jgi:hypothetical protein
MEVNCISIQLDLESNNMHNANLEDSLEIGSKYFVHRIVLDREIVYFLIWDGSHFIHAPSGMFEISVNSIPKGWVFEVENKGASIGPALFNQDFWFDDFSEKPEDERRKIVNNLRPK